MAAMRSDNLNMTKAPPLRGFCFPAIRQGYSRDALHQYPCHIVVEQHSQLLSLGTRRGAHVLAKSICASIFSEDLGSAGLVLSSCGH